MNGKNINKGMVLRVTDPELLELTGGIVQGMSGSPILQNRPHRRSRDACVCDNRRRGMGFLLRICFRVWKCRTEKQERNRKRNCGSLWAAVFLVKEHKMDAEK